MQCCVASIHLQGKTLLNDAVFGCDSKAERFATVLKWNRKVVFESHVLSKSALPSLIVPLLPANLEYGSEVSATAAV